jgi:hypothetical protein
LIKMAQGAWHGDASFGSGLVSLYFFRFPVEMVFSFLLLPFTFFALRNSDPNARSLARIAIGYGVIHYIAYSALKVPPYHWYYAHLVLGVVIAGSVGAAVIARHLRRSRYLLLIIPLSAILYIASDGIPISEAPIHTNWATHEQYRQFAEWIRQNTDPSNTFLMAGEIGTLAYYSDRTLLNNFSNQWSLQRLLIQKFNRESEWKRRLFRWNFLFRKEAVRYRHSTYRIDHVLHPHVPRTDRGVIYYRHTSTKWIPDGVLYVRKTGQQ